jgi:hypothetical protein
LTTMPNGEFKDDVARQKAESAFEMAKSAWEGVGDVLRELAGVRTELKTGFAAVRSEIASLKADRRSTPSLESKPGSGRRAYERDDEEDEDHEFGRREYDPEITANGVHVKVSREGFYREQAELRQLREDVDEFKKKQKEAELKAAGAKEALEKVEAERDEDNKKFDRWLKRGGGILTIVAILAAGAASVATYFVHQAQIEQQQKNK